MENIADKLQNYRLRKRRRERLQRFKNRLRDFIMLGVSNTEKQINRPSVTINVAENPLGDLSKSIDDEDTTSHDEDTILNDEDNRNVNLASTGDTILRYTLWVVYFAFWVTLYIISIELQFGIVFVMLSVLIAIYFNTRTGPKKHNEISAYSVFNKNCESIDGTLKAEQFEREMGIR